MGGREHDKEMDLRQRLGGERPELAALSPELHVKIQMHSAGLEPASDRKRKRSDD